MSGDQLLTPDAASTAGSPMSASHGTEIRRYTSANPCPVCGGWEARHRGRGERCHGFLSSSGDYARCSREEHAGGLPIELSTACYVHRLIGTCLCGQTHGGGRPHRDGGEAQRERRRHAGAHGRRRISKTYPYRDEQGELLYQAVRYEPKGFRLRRPDGRGGWIWNVKGAGLVPYRLPELLTAVAAGDTIYITEGEKDADAIWEAAGAATCNPMGAGKWRDDFAPHFEGAHVVIVADWDEPGRKHAEAVARSLRPVAASLRTVRAQSGKDAADHFAAGRALDDFIPVDPDPKEPRLLTPSEFAGDRLPGALVERLIFRASTHLLAGPAKGGKTYLALQLAMALRAGVRVFDLHVPKKCTVLYVSLEMTAAMMRERMEAIARDLGMPLPAIGNGFEMVAPTEGRAPTIDLSSSEGRSDLRGLIRQARAEVTILDTLYRFTPGMDPLSQMEMGELFGWLNETATVTGSGLVVLDHTRKGDHVGPVAHAAIGAQTKGGAARLIASLERISRANGGQWKLDVDSHFGSWDEEIFYERPVRADGTRGGGCVAISPAKARGLSVERLWSLFLEHGERDEAGRLWFPSKNQLTQALQKAGMASGNAIAGQLIETMEREYAIPEEQHAPGSTEPIVTRKGSNRATAFIWVGDQE